MNSKPKYKKNHTAYLNCKVCGEKKACLWKVYKMSNNKVEVYCSPCWKCDNYPDKPTVKPEEVED